MNIRELTEASGYIAKNAEEARDSRWSASLSVDVHTDTMRKQLGDFFPTSAPDDGQVQVKEAKEDSMKQTVNEGQGSINVETHYDVSRIKKLAGLANSSTVAGTPVSEELEADDNMTPDQAEALAAQLEEHLEQMSDALYAIESIVRKNLPREYRYMEAYTFAHIKTSMGGHGYVDRMTRSIASLIEDLQEFQGFDDE